MEFNRSSVTIKELIGEINTLRKHISWTNKEASSQLQREILKIRSDVISTLERYQADDKHRQYLEKSFLRLGQLQNDRFNLVSGEKDQSSFRSFVEKLDRQCCNIQLYLSDLELPSLSAR